MSTSRNSAIEGEGAVRYQSISFSDDEEAENINKLTSHPPGSQQNLSSSSSGPERGGGGGAVDDTGQANGASETDGNPYTNLARLDALCGRLASDMELDTVGETTTTTTTGGDGDHQAGLDGGTTTTTETGGDEVFDSDDTTGHPPERQRGGGVQNAKQAHEDGDEEEEEELPGDLSNESIDIFQGMDGEGGEAMEEGVMAVDVASYTCTLCGQTFGLQHQVETHLMMEHDLGEQTALFSVLKKVSKKKRVWRRDKDGFFPCLFCHYRSRRSISVRQHEVEKHPGKELPAKQYVCKLCSQRFALQEIFSHIQADHPNEAESQLVGNNLTEHYTVTFSREGRDTPSTTTTTTTATAAAADQTRRAPSSSAAAETVELSVDGYYHCGKCDFVSKELAVFTEHFKEHSCAAQNGSAMTASAAAAAGEEEFNYCQYCSYKSRSKRGLRLHERMQHPQSDNKKGQLTCSTCGERRMRNVVHSCSDAKANRQLKLARTSEGHFMCATCPYTCKVYRSIFVHARIHKHEVAHIEPVVMRAPLGNSYPNDDDDDDPDGRGDGPQQKSLGPGRYHQATPGENMIEKDIAEGADTTTVAGGRPNAAKDAAAAEEEEGDGAHTEDRRAEGQETVKSGDTARESGEQNPSLMDEQYDAALEEEPLESDSQSYIDDSDNDPAWEPPGSGGFRQRHPNAGAASDDDDNYSDSDIDSDLEPDSRKRKSSDDYDAGGRREKRRRSSDFTKDPRCPAPKKLANGNFQCNFCDFESKWPNSTEMHQWRHTGFRPFRCDVCGKGFRQKSQMEKHVFKCRTDPQQAAGMMEYESEEQAVGMDSTNLEASQETTAAATTTSSTSTNNPMLISPTPIVIAPPPGWSEPLSSNSVGAGEGVGQAHHAMNEAGGGAGGGSTLQDTSSTHNWTEHQQHQQDHQQQHQQQQQQQPSRISPPPDGLEPMMVREGDSAPQPQPTTVNRAVWAETNPAELGEAAKEQSSDLSPFSMAEPALSATMSTEGNPDPSGGSSSQVGGAPGDEPPVHSSSPVVPSIWPEPGKDLASDNSGLAAETPSDGVCTSLSAPALSNPLVTPLNITPVTPHLAVSDAGLGLIATPTLQDTQDMDSDLPQIFNMVDSQQSSMATGAGAGGHGTDSAQEPLSSSSPASATPTSLLTAENNQTGLQGSLPKESPVTTVPEGEGEVPSILGTLQIPGPPEGVSNLTPITIDDEVSPDKSPPPPGDATTAAPGENAGGAVDGGSEPTSTTAPSSSSMETPASVVVNGSAGTETVSSAAATSALSLTSTASSALTETATTAVAAPSGGAATTVSVSGSETMSSSVSNTPSAVTTPAQSAVSAAATPATAGVAAATKTPAGPQATATGRPAESGGSGLKISDLYKCILCRVYFEDQAMYRHHMGHHGSTVGTCRICNRMFRTPLLFVNHLHCSAQCKGLNLAAPMNTYTPRSRGRGRGRGSTVQPVQQMTQPMTPAMAQSATIRGRSVMVRGQTYAGPVQNVGMSNVGGPRYVSQVQRPAQVQAMQQMVATSTRRGRPPLSTRRPVQQQQHSVRPTMQQQHPSLQQQQQQPHLQQQAQYLPPMHTQMGAVRNVQPMNRQGAGLTPARKRAPPPNPDDVIVID